MYLIRYIDMQGTKREWLSRANELRKAVEDFYLDECPAHISSVVELPPTAAKICKEMIP